MVKDLIIRSIFALCIVFYTSKFATTFYSMAEDKENRKDLICWVSLVYNLICATLLLVGLSKMGV